MLPLKVFCKEQPSVIHFLWEKELVQMPFTVRCIQGVVTGFLRDQQYMFGVKKIGSWSRKCRWWGTSWSLLFRRPMQRSQQSILSHSLTSVWWDECLN